MKTYYEVRIICTARSFSPQEEPYHIFHDEKHQFGTLEDARAFIVDQYSGHKRVKMFNEESGEPVQNGWVYCFNDEDSTEHWHQQDWVTIHKVTSKEVL